MNRSSKLSRASSTLLTTAHAVVTAMLMTSTTARAENPIDPDVEKILRERLVVLTEAFKLQQESYRKGEGSFERVLGAARVLSDARLELAGNAQERIKIREEIVANARALEETVRKIFEGQQGSQADLLNAKASRLRAEADLITERKSARR